jgi:hypothetical protein
MNLRRVTNLEPTSERMRLVICLQIPTTVWKGEKTTSLSYWMYRGSAKDSGQLSRYSDGLRAGRPRFDSRQWKIFLFSTASRPTVGPIQPPVQLVTGALAPRVKRQWREENHLVPRSRKVELYLHNPVCLHGIMLN